MATDLTRVRKNSEKRGVSVASFVMNGEDFPATGDYIMANLPEKSIVTNVFTSITTLDTTAATVTCTVKIGGVAVTAGKNIGSGGTTGASKSVTGLPIDTSTGMELSVTVATAAPTEAKATVMVEYMEQQLVTGQLTAVN